MLLDKGFTSAEIEASGDHIQSFRPSGKGNGTQFRVYAWVLKGLLEFVQGASPDTVKLKGATGKQSDLYKKLFIKITPQLGALGYRVKGLNIVRA